MDEDDGTGYGLASMTMDETGCGKKDQPFVRTKDEPS